MLLCNIPFDYRKLVANVNVKFQGLEVDGKRRELNSDKTQSHETGQNGTRTNLHASSCPCVFFSLDRTIISIAIVVSDFHWFQFSILTTMLKWNGKWGRERIAWNENQIAKLGIPFFHVCVSVMWSKNHMLVVAVGDAFVFVAAVARVDSCSTCYWCDYIKFKRTFFHISICSRSLSASCWVFVC